MSKLKGAPMPEQPTKTCPTCGAALVRPSQVEVNYEPEVEVTLDYNTEDERLDASDPPVPRCWFCNGRTMPMRTVAGLATCNDCYCPTKGAAPHNPEGPMSKEDTR